MQNDSKQILIVEDDKDIQTLLKFLLTREGMKVTQAWNGREGLQKVAEVYPDLILADLMMPELDGLEMLECLRRNPATYPIPVIVLTALDKLEKIVEALDKGADDYITKPFSSIEVMARIKTRLTRQTMV